MPLVCDAATAAAITLKYNDVGPPIVLPEPARLYTE